MIGSVLRVRYELTSVLADGPLFATYSARDRVNNRDVSVRVLKDPYGREPDFLERLRAAVHRYRGVQSPMIESLFDVEEDEDRPFVVGELSRGPHLAERIRKLAPFSVPVSVATAIGICRALEPLHRNGLPHGDVSPSNIVLVRESEVRLQLAGIWEAYGGSPTAGSMVLPAMAPYLAPEISSESLPSPASDVYSIGVILFELLAGRQPYIADSARGVVALHRDADAPEIRSLNPSVPAVLEQIILKAMSKDPAERYPNAAEMLVDLRILQDALRFGRSVSWPLRGGIPSPVPTKAATRVAPKMDAVKQETVDRNPRRPERDVPVWMIAIMTLLAGAILGLGGIWLVFNLNKPKLIAVPNIRGLNVAEARTLLQGSKLNIRISSREANDAVEADKILEVTPEPGQKVREGGEVGVVVSAGSRYVEVPDVKGMTMDRAKGVLAGLNLDVENPVTNAPNDAPLGTVFRQNPDPRTRVERLTKIRLYVSSGAVTIPPPVVNENVEYLYTVRVRVRDVPDSVLVRVDIIDRDSPDGRTVYVSEHRTGETITVESRSRDKKVKFRVYYDDEEVRTIEKSADGAERT